MLTYKSDMEKHARCAREAGLPQEVQASGEELQATLAKLNRRARGK
jgi:hypothetical protein